MPLGQLRRDSPINEAINARLRDPAVQQQHADALYALSHALADGLDDYDAQSHALATQAGFTGALGLRNWSMDNVDTLQSFSSRLGAVSSSSDDDSDSTMDFSDGTDIEGDATDVEGDGLRGGNLANSISDVASDIGTAAGVAGLASGATGIGAPIAGALGAVSGLSKGVSFVADLFGDGQSAHDAFMNAAHAYCGQRGSGPFDERLTVPEVMAAQQNLRDNPAAARLYRQKLVTPGQAADSRFVSNLEYTALSQQQKPRRYAKVPRYRGTRYAKKIETSYK